MDHIGKGAAEQNVLGAAKHVTQCPVDPQEAAVAVGERHAHSGLVERDPELLLALGQRLGRPLALRDVLDLVDDVEGPAGRVPDQRHGQQDRDLVAVGMDPPVFQLVALSHAGQELVGQDQVRFEIVGLDQIAETQRHQLILGVPGDVAEGPVDAQPLAVEVDHRDADRCVLEGQLQRLGRIHVQVDRRRAAGRGRHRGRQVDVEAVDQRLLDRFDLGGGRWAQELARLAQLLGRVHGRGPLPQGTDLTGLQPDDDVDVGVAPAAGRLDRLADRLAGRRDLAGHPDHVGPVDTRLPRSDGAFERSQLQLTEHRLVVGLQVEAGRHRKAQKAHDTERVGIERAGPDRRSIGPVGTGPGRPVHLGPHHLAVGQRLHPPGPTEGGDQPETTSGDGVGRVGPSRGSGGRVVPDGDAYRRLVIGHLEGERGPGVEDGVGQQLGPDHDGKVHRGFGAGPAGQRDANKAPPGAGIVRSWLEIDGLPKGIDGRHGREPSDAVGGPRGRGYRRGGP